MDDLIQRQAAIEAIYACYIGGKEAVDKAPANDEYAEGIDEAVRAVEDLPSVQPERHGRWVIEEKDSIYGKKYILTCSECGDIYAVSEAALPHEKYCRNCGARNRR